MWVRVERDGAYQMIRYGLNTMILEIRRGGRVMGLKGYGVKRIRS